MPKKEYPVMIISLHFKCVRFLLNDWEGHIAIDIHIIILSSHIINVYVNIIHFHMNCTHKMKIQRILGDVIFKRVCFAYSSFRLLLLLLFEGIFLEKKIHSFLFVCLFVKVKARVKWKSFKCFFFSIMQKATVVFLSFFQIFIHNIT